MCRVLTDFSELPAGSGVGAGRIRDLSAALKEADEIQIICALSGG